MSHIIPLTAEDVSKKRELLVRTLTELSEQYLEDDSKFLEQYASRMSEVYSNGYRQLYSELYTVMSAISNKDVDSLQPLSTNLICLYRYVGGSDWRIRNPELFGHLLKLSDHVNLEMQRIVDHQASTEKFDELYENLRGMYEDSNAVKRKLQKATKKIKDLQLEMVSILAIFAAIVVAFSGGMNVLGNAISGVGHADLQDLAFMVILCGIVLFNTVTLLMHIVFWIIRRLHDDDDNENESKLIDWQYIVGFNVLLIILLGITLCV